MYFQLFNPIVDQDCYDKMLDSGPHGVRAIAMSQPSVGKSSDLTQEAIDGKARPGTMYNVHIEDIEHLLQ
jgi:hypothetical protein